MKEALKYIGKKIIFAHVPKYLSIPLGIVAVGFMGFISIGDSDSKNVEERRHTLVSIVGIVSFVGLAVSKMTSGFSTIPSLAGGILLTLIGGAIIYTYSRYISKGVSLRNSSHGDILIAGFFGVAIAGGFYLLKEGCKTVAAVESEQMKEALKNFGKMLLFDPIPKYTSISLGIAASVIMGIMSKLKIKYSSLEKPNLDRVIGLVGLAGLGGFLSLAISSMTSQFNNIIPKPVSEILLTLVGSAVACSYLIVAYSEKKIQGRIFCTIPIIGGVYLAREGVRALISK